MVRKTQVCRSRFENVRTSAAKVRNEKWGYPFKIHFYKRFQGHRNIKHARVWYFRVRVAQFLFETFFHIVRVLLDFSVVRYKSDTLYIYCLDVCVGWRLYEKYPSSASRSRSSRSAWLVIHSMYLSTYILSWKDLIYGTHMRRSLSLLPSSTTRKTERQFRTVEASRSHSSFYIPFNTAAVTRASAADAQHAKFSSWRRRTC